MIPTSMWSGWTNAVDPVTGKMALRVKWPTLMYATITPTAGNVQFTGDLSGNFLTLDARDGKTLYSFDTGGPVAASPTRSRASNTWLLPPATAAARSRSPAARPWRSSASRRAEVQRFSCRPGRIAHAVQS
jgi:outer membrane protein assembly factor BamB